jgi:hypothetical protein
MIPVSTIAATVFWVNTTQHKPSHQWNADAPHASKLVWYCDLYHNKGSYEEVPTETSDLGTNLHTNVADLGATSELSHLL